MVHLFLFFYQDLSKITLKQRKNEERKTKGDSSEVGGRDGEYKNSCRINAPGN
jgi:hypothetical protein